VRQASWIFVVLAALLVAGSALAAPADSMATAPASPPPAQTPPSQPSAQMAPPTSQAAATPAASEDPAYAALRDKAKAATGSQVAGLNKNLTVVSKQMDDMAAKDGDTAVATRLAGDFGVTTETLVAYRSKYGAGWGDLTIGYTLVANAQGVTPDQAFRMHSEGIGWGEIASSMGLNLGQVESATKEEGKVVAGTSKPDGKAAKIAMAPPPKAPKAPKTKTASADGAAPSGTSDPAKDSSKDPSGK